MDGNTEHLQARFFERLLSHAPASALDVGCGRGALLDRCRAAGLPATGLESSADRVAELRARGHLAVLGSADRVPLQDGAFDWVLLRHVPHHLADLPGALAEAARVARSGLLLAEPWQDPELPAQRTTQRIDAWRRRQDRRQGRVHNPSYTPAGLLALLPEGLGERCEYEFHLRPRLQPLEELRAGAGHRAGEAARLLERLEAVLQAKPD